MENTRVWALAKCTGGLLLALLTAAVIAGGASAAQTGDTYSGSGNWVINQPTTLTGQSLNVSGDITVLSTLTVTNATITFTVPDATFSVRAPSGALTMSPGNGSTTVASSNATYYWYFIIEETTGNVNIQNVSLDHTRGGVQVTGGSAASRYFAHITMTHARGYGFRLTDSYATLFKLNVTLQMRPTLTRTELWNYNNYTQTARAPYYWYSYRYHYIYDYWTISATGVNVTRGGPWVDGVEIHAPSETPRVDFNLTGGVLGFYDYRNQYKAGCNPNSTFSYSYWFNYTYHNIYPTLAFVGFDASDTRFAYFHDVRSPPEDLSFDVHYNIVGGYHYERDYCNVLPYYTYDNPDLAYSFNQLRWYTADVIGVHVRDGGLGNSFSGVNASMGSAGVSLTDDWGGSATYKNIWLASYSTFPSVMAFAFWSEENYALTAPSAVTAVDFTLRDSVVSGAGMRFDRYYTYTPATATVFRGAVLADNISVRGVEGLGLMVNISASSPNARPTYDFAARVSNSSFQGGRAFSLALPNAATSSSDYTAAVLIENNRFTDSSMVPDPVVTSAYTPFDPCLGTYSYRYYASTYDAVVSLDTGAHCGRFSSDTFAADVLVRANVWHNTTGPAFGWEYSDYTFGGGSTLGFEGNTFDQVHFFPVGASGAPSTSDAMIKTVADQITFRGNVFSDVDVVFGLLGGSSWGSSATNPSYYGFAYCPSRMMSSSYYTYYAAYGCSFPLKTPQLDVEGNTFSRLSSPSASNGLQSFFLLPGRANLTLAANTVSDSKATLVLANLNYHSIKFPVEDIFVNATGNTVTNQSSKPLFAYSDPYASGNPFRMTYNTYRDSSAPMFAWMWSYYTNSYPQYRPAQNLVQLRLIGNTFSNLSLGAQGAVHLTGRVTLSNNSWDGVVGWAAIIDYMANVPSIASNVVSNSTNGYWLEPVSTGGVRPTASFADLVIRVADTAIRMVGGNLVLQRMDFTGAQTAVHVKDGFAEVYSSKILVLSGRVEGSATITAYSSLGYALRWSDASGADSGVPVYNGLVVTSTPTHRILSSSRTDAAGLVAPRVVQVWKLTCAGTVTTVENDLPLEVLISAGGLTQSSRLPDLSGGQTLTYFEDHAAYPLLIKDPVVPVASVGSPGEGDQLGSPLVTMTGYTFEHGSGVDLQRVQLDGGPWIEVTPGPTGSWSLVVDAGAEGAHTLRVQVADTAGNVDETVRSFFVDATPPSLTVLRPVEETTVTNRPVVAVQGHVAPADAEVTANGVPLLLTSQGDFFYNLTLNDGLNVLFVAARDRAGNEALLVRSVTFDRYPPFLQVTSPVDHLLTRVPRVDVVGRAEPGAAVTVNGFAAFVDPDTGAFRLPNILLDTLFAQTENVLVVRATDAAGNVAFDNRTVVADTQAPSIEFDLDPAVRAAIAAGQPVAVAVLDVRGRTDSADARLTIAGQEVELIGLTFSRAIVLAEGANLIEVRAGDAAHNEQTVVLHVTRDTVRPTLTLERPGSDSVLTNQTTMEIAGYTDTEGSVVTVIYTDARGVQAADPVPTVAVGTPIKYRFEYTLQLVTDGNEHAVEVRASDGAGNFASQVFTYTAKVGKPFLEVVGFKERISQTSMWVNGTTEAGITEVTINGRTFDVVDQFFAVRWNMPITQGNYSFTVSVRDAAGNQNVFQGRTQVDVPQAVGQGGAVGGGQADATVAVSAAAALLGAAAMVLLFALARRRQEP